MTLCWIAAKKKDKIGKRLFVVSGHLPMWFMSFFRVLCNLSSDQNVREVLVDEVEGCQNKNKKCQKLYKYFGKRGVRFGDDFGVLNLSAMSWQGKKKKGKSTHFVYRSFIIFLICLFSFLRSHDDRSKSKESRATTGRPISTFLCCDSRASAWSFCRPASEPSAPTLHYFIW